MNTCHYHQVISNDVISKFRSKFQRSILNEWTCQHHLQILCFLLTPYKCKKKLINFNFGTDCVNTFLSHEFEFVLQCLTQDFEILTGMYGILCVSYRSIFVSFYSSHSFSFFHIFLLFRFSLVALWRKKTITFQLWSF